MNREKIITFGCSSQDFTRHVYSQFERGKNDMFLHFEQKIDMYKNAPFSVFHHYYDFGPGLAYPGGPSQFASCDKRSAEFRFTMKQLSMSKELHNPKYLFLLGHACCKRFEKDFVFLNEEEKKLFLQSKSDKEKERLFYQNRLNRAAEMIASNGLFKKEQIKMYYLNNRGYFLNTDGTLAFKVLETPAPITPKESTDKPKEDDKKSDDFNCY